MNLVPCKLCGADGAPVLRCGGEDGGPERPPYVVECCECYSVTSPEFNTAAEAAAWWEGYQTSVEDWPVTSKKLVEQAAEYENRLVEHRAWQKQGVDRIEALEGTCTRLLLTLQEIKRMSYPSEVCDNCRHCQSFASEDFCVSKGDFLEDTSSQSCPQFVPRRLPEVYTLAKQALEA